MLLLDHAVEGDLRLVSADTGEPFRLFLVEGPSVGVEDDQVFHRVESLDEGFEIPVHQGLAAGDDEP